MLSIRCKCSAYLQEFAAEVEKVSTLFKRLEKVEVLLQLIDSSNSEK